MKNGIDVSQFQGEIDWKSVTADFVIIRAGYGRELYQKDPRFEQNYKGCHDRGIPCGAYWYSYAVTPEDARKEAAVCLSVLKGKQFEYPIFFDIEEQRQFALGKAACTAIARAFLETVESAGYFVGLYSSQYFLENYFDEELRKRYTVWVAQYDVQKPTYSGSYSIWQRTGKGRAPGIAGDVDLDESTVDFPSIIKEAGLNGYAKPQTTPSASLKIPYPVTLTINGSTYTGTLYLT